MRATNRAVVAPTPELDVVDLGPTSSLMEFDIDLAARTAWIHRTMPAPDGPRCLSCGAAHPCRWARWARCVLMGAGWSDAEIATEIDLRSSG